MTNNRQSIRLPGYDYTQRGAYFVTICTQDLGPWFGKIEETGVGKPPEMVLNDAGRMVQTVWDEIPQNYGGIKTDAFVIMPNHVHGIIVIVGAERGTDMVLSLPDVVQRFKVLTTKRYGDGVRSQGWRAFRGKLWQRNYYEHIIRNNEDLDRIRTYILNNPAEWKTDPENPSVMLQRRGSVSARNRFYDP